MTSRTVEHGGLTLLVRAFELHDITGHRHPEHFFADVHEAATDRSYVPIAAPAFPLFLVDAPSEHDALMKVIDTIKGGHFVPYKS